MDGPETTTSSESGNLTFVPAAIISGTYNRTATVEIYKNKKRQFCWRLKARNGKTIADGAESYKTHQGVEKAVQSFITSELVVKDKTLKK